MPQKWNLQDIRPQGTPRARSSRSANTRNTPQQDIAPRTVEREPDMSAPEPERPRMRITDDADAKRTRLFVSAGIAAGVIALGIFVNMFLGGATVTVHPKVKDISVHTQITAKTAPQVDELGYELMTLEATGERQVKATGKEEVEERATGTIFVYNTGSTLQRLIKNTRFETKDGLIFRINESVEVPPAQDGTPGKVAAAVFADGTGDTYNVPPQRFTIPGLEGTEQFDNMYGESTGAFTGGFTGERYILDEAELAAAQETLHTELRNTLMARLQTERPAGFVSYDDAIAVSFESLPATEYGDSLATIKERARLQIPLFKEDAFAAFLAKQTVSDYTGEPVRVLDPSTLRFAYESATTTTLDLSGATELAFSLDGTAQLVWQIDEGRLTEELSGTKKSDAPRIFTEYAAIRSAQAELRPFWKSSFPKDPKDIKVETVLDAP